MAKRMTTPWFVLSVCACLPGCTVLVESTIDDKPAYKEAEDDTDADSDGGGGSGVDASNDARDSSPDLDGDEADRDSSMNSEPDVGPGDDGGPGSDAGAASGKICIGYNYACGIDATGKIHCWGANAENQHMLPTDRTYVDVACGDYHSCGIDSAGALVCAGRNRSGQRQTQTGPFAQVTAGEDQTCTLDASGTARCWGATDRGQSTPPSETFSALSAGGGFTCGIRKANGALMCWGEGATMMMTQAAGKKLVSIEAGPDFVCGVTDAGEGACWGQNDYSISGLVDIKQIAGGLYSGCALLADDSVRCWYYGSSMLIAPAEAPFSFVAVGGTGRCAVRKSGGVYCEPEDTSAIAPGPDEFP
jgi:hypothetical protein